MRKLRLNLNNNKGRLLQDDLSINLDVLLYPTAVYITPQGSVTLNKPAYELLGLKDKQDFNIDKWRSINPHVKEILIKIDRDIITEQKILITLFNGKKEIVSFNLSIHKNNEVGRIYIIQFMKAANKYSVGSLSSLYSVGDEVKKLMPYLNNAGKSLLKEIIQTHFQEENKQLIAEDLIYYEREIKIIEEAFPDLSHQEVLICGLLINDMDSNEISLLTKKSLNSIFVAIHRINKKLDIKDRKELVDTLQKLIYEHNEQQTNKRIIEDFDI